MCAFSFTAPINTEYVRDVHRGRIKDPCRFFQLEAYAQKRWEQSRNPAHYSHWRKIMETVKRRTPR